jgi:hypothetical protein
MRDGWLRRDRDGTLWRVTSVEAYTKHLKEGFTACEPPEIVPVAQQLPELTATERQALEREMVRGLYRARRA